MAKQDEEKLWLLKDLFEIPALTCDVEDLDFTAIISRFHFLLLEQNEKTYEEFVKYWALLIVTAPDTFKAKELWGNQLFAGVHSDVSKFNMPKEEIKLPLGNPKIEEAENFGERIWKRYLHRDLASKMDDSKVYAWYTDPAKTLEARAFFGCYCINLMRAYTQPPASVAEECGHEHPWSFSSCGYTEREKISFNTGTAIFLRDAFRSEAETFRKILRMELHWSLSLPPIDKGYCRDICHDQKAARFHSHAVEEPMRFSGLTILNPELFAWWYQLRSLKAYMKKITDTKLLSSMRNVRNVIIYLDGVRSQDGTFLDKNPNCIGDSCKFWSYSRLFSPQYFESLADEHNLEFLAFCIGFANNNLDSDVKNGVCFKKLTKTERIAYITWGRDARNIQPNGFDDLKMGSLWRIPPEFHHPLLKLL